MGPFGYEISNPSEHKNFHIFALAMKGHKKLPTFIPPFWEDKFGKQEMSNFPSILALYTRVHAVYGCWTLVVAVLRIRVLNGPLNVQLDLSN